MTVVTQDMTQAPIPAVGHLSPPDTAAARGVILGVLLGFPLWIGLAAVLSAVL